MHSRSFLLGTWFVALAFCACAEGTSVDDSTGGTGGGTTDASVGGAGGSATGGDGGSAGMPDGGSGGDGGSAGTTGGTGGVGGTGGDTGGAGGSTGGTGGSTGGTGGSAGGTAGSTGGTGGSTGGTGGSTGGTGGSTGGTGGTTGGAGGGTGGGSSCNAPGTCTLYPQSGCGPGQGCYVVEASTGRTGCEYTAGVGQAQPCEYLNDCAAGLACIGGACKPYCVTANDCSTNGAECFQVVYDPGNGSVADVPCMKVCSDQCDPANPGAVCGDNLNCDITSDYQVKPGFSLCYDSGSTNTGACSSASPQCAPGYVCLTDNKCHRWCKEDSPGCLCQAAGYYVGLQEYGFCQ